MSEEKKLILFLSGSICGTILFIFISLLITIYINEKIINTKYVKYIPQREQYCIKQHIKNTNLTYKESVVRCKELYGEHLYLYKEDND